MNTQRRTISTETVRQPGSRRRLSGQVSLPELLETRTLLSAYLVTSNADDGSVGTLRDAIKQVNLGSVSEIDFGFSTPTTITLGSSLDKITHAVLINGTKDASGNALVTLHGSVGAANGLVIDASSVTVKDLSIGGFSGAGVILELGGGDTLQGDYIGLDSTGSFAMPNGTGVSVLTGSNMLVGNVISGNFFDGVDVTGDSNTLQGNLIGTDKSGLNAVGNGSEGVLVNNATNTLVGGTTAGARNVISGNGMDGIAFSNDTVAGNAVQGNLIGTDITGLAPLGNGMHGVNIGTSSGLLVSNLVVVNNVISANQGNGIFVKNGSNNTIRSNDIGTDANGHAGTFDSVNWDYVMGNVGDGIRLMGGSTGDVISSNIISGNGQSGITLTAGAGTTGTIQNNLIGVDMSLAVDSNLSAGGIVVRTGSVFASGNTIAGNMGYGVVLDTFADPSTLVGNFIGTDSALASGLGNGADGILINGSNNVIGGASAGAGNVIAYNAGAGVFVFSGTGNSIRGNSIFSNADLGIALGNETVVLANNTVSSPAPNNNQNYPVISSVTGFVGGSLTVTGTMQGQPNTTYALDFFSNTSPDGSNYGEGQTYLGSLLTVTTDASGNATFSAAFANVPAGQSYWSATATNPAGNTSEFSMDVQSVITVPQKSNTSLGINSSLNPSAFGQQVTFTATVTPAGGTATLSGTISFIVNNTVMSVVTVSNGSATWTSSFPVGNTTVTAVYSGDSNYLGSQNTFAQTVNQAATSTSLVSSLNPSTFGQQVTFTATVTPASGNVLPGGTISFLVNNVVMKVVTLNGGNSATYSASLNGGGSSVTAVYSGDGNYLASQAGLTQNVNHAATQTTVVSSLNPSVAGQAVTFTATVLGNGVVPTGTVTFKDNGVTLATVSLNASGVATFSSSALSASSHTISATYNGDGNYLTSSGSLTQTVNALLGTINGHTYTDTTGNGLSPDDTPLAGITVELYLDKNNDGVLNGPDGTAIKSVVSDSNGAFSFSSLAPGRYFVQEIVPSGYVRTAPKPGAYYTDVITSGLMINSNDFDNKRTGKPLPVTPTVVVGTSVFNNDSKITNGDSHGKKLACGHDKGK
jgi:parallel beta-helix repeat protein